MFNTENEKIDAHIENTIMPLRKTLPGNFASVSAEGVIIIGPLEKKVREDTQKIVSKKKHSSFVTVPIHPYD